MWTCYYMYFLILLLKSILQCLWVHNLSLKTQWICFSFKEFNMQQKTSICQLPSGYRPLLHVHCEDSHVYLLLMLLYVGVCKTGYFLPTRFSAIKRWTGGTQKTKQQIFALTYLILTGRFSQFNEVVLCKGFAFSVSFSLRLQLFTFWHEDFPSMRKPLIQQCCADSHVHEGDERSSRNILSESLVRIRNRHVFFLKRKTLHGTYSIQVAEFRTFSRFFTDFWKPVVKNFNVSLSFSCSVCVVLLRILTTCRKRDPSSKFPLAALLSQLVPVFSRTTSFPKSTMFSCSK